MSKIPADDKSLGMINCPRCGNTVAWEGNPHRPFCSEACRLVDLGNWADESYRIPTTEKPGLEPDGLDNE